MTKLTKSELLKGEPVERIVSSKLKGRNTVEFLLDDGTYVVKYHDTHVVTISGRDGLMLLNSGGFKTATTKVRINAELSSRCLSIRQNNGYWILTRDGYDVSYFYDGMVIDQRGKLVSGVLEPDIKSVEKKRKEIKEYVDNMSKEDVRLPDNGDCMYCSMISQDGLTLGDTIKDISHLELHIKERYYPGALLYNALIDRGFQPFQAQIFLRCVIDRHQTDYHMNVIQKSLFRYLKKRLIPELAVT